jgi:hypothetical protein
LDKVGESLVKQAATESFSQELFHQHPDLIPTRSLYLDLEGSGGGTDDDSDKGTESVLTVCWPQKGESDRYKRIRRPSRSQPMTQQQLVDVLDELSINRAKLNHIVVFSGGMEEPGEKKRFEKVFGKNIFGNSEWVNLHTVLRKTKQMKLAIRDSRWVWLTGKTSAHYCLEALEHEFNFRRPVNTRAHSNSYADGNPGMIYALKLANSWVDGSATVDDIRLLELYTRQDVEGMFRITQKSGEIMRTLSL